MKFTVSMREKVHCCGDGEIARITFECDAIVLELEGFECCWGDAEIIYVQEHMQEGALVRVWPHKDSGESVTISLKDTQVEGGADALD